MTYVAANNQRHMLFLYTAKKDTQLAINTYPYFELNPLVYGGLSLDLKLQDNAGVNSGTQVNWKRSFRSWNFIPTASDQSTYEALWNFGVPQDVIALDSADTKGDSSFQCYASIPPRENLPPQLTPAQGRDYVAQDMDGLAYGNYDDGKSLFTRVRVNGTTPLAGWLLDVGRDIAKKTLFSLDDKQRDHVPPGQMTYTFTILISIGLDVKYSLTSATPWDALGADVNAGMQQTSTITVILNGLEAGGVVSAKQGTAAYKEALPLPVLGTVAPKHPAANNLGFVFQPTRRTQGYIGRTVPRSVPTYPPLLQQWGAPQ